MASLMQIEILIYSGKNVQQRSPTETNSLALIISLEVKCASIEHSSVNTKSKSTGGAQLVPVEIQDLLRITELKPCLKAPRLISGGLTFDFTPSVCNLMGD